MMRRWYYLLLVARDDHYARQKRRKEPVFRQYKKSPGYHYCWLHKKNRVKVEGYRIQRLQISHQQRGLLIQSTSILQQKADTGNQS